MTNRKAAGNGLGSHCINTSKNQGRVPVSKQGTASFASFSLYQYKQDGRRVITGDMLKCLKNGLQSRVMKKRKKNATYLEQRGEPE